MRIPALAFVVTLAGCPAPPPPPSAPPPMSSADLDARFPRQSATARRILARVAALASEFPVLVGFEPSRCKPLNQSRYFMRCDHEVGIGTEPNPAYDPSMPYSAVAPLRTVVQPGGLRLTFFFTDEDLWGQLAVTKIVRVGPIHVYAIVEGNAALERRIREILDEESRS